MGGPQRNALLAASAIDLCGKDRKAAASKRLEYEALSISTAAACMGSGGGPNIWLQNHFCVSPEHVHTHEMRKDERQTRMPRQTDREKIDGVWTDSKPGCGSRTRRAFRDPADFLGERPGSGVE
jgi:hypothetical protein